MEEKHRVKLILDLSKSIAYWTGRNDDYAAAYMTMLHAFTSNDDEQETIEE